MTCTTAYLQAALLKGREKYNRKAVLRPMIARGLQLALQVPLLAVPDMSYSV
jgi:hypothetical protein